MSRTSHRGDCSRCGASSPRYPTRAEAHSWISQHRGVCTRTRTAKPATNWDKVDELVARARKHKPLDPSLNGPGHVSRGEPRRVDVDKWGGSRGGGVSWVGVNCLRSSIANLVGASDFKQIPDPEPIFENSDDWLADYSVVLAEATGYRLEEESVAACLHVRNSGKRWIAGIKEEGPADHALVAAGANVLFDPAQEYQGQLPLDRVFKGLRLVKASAPKRDRWGAEVR